MTNKAQDKQLSLTDADISSSRNVTRRSLLGLGLGLGAAAATVAGGAARVAAQRGSGCTDNDRGPNEDPTGSGRRCRGPTSGCTDNDRGPQEDPPGGGKWCWI
jgi:hypothetical protein